MANGTPGLHRSAGDGILLSGTECGNCGLRWFPPLEYGCEGCGAHGDALSPRSLAAAGTIYSCTRVPLAEGATMHLAIVILDEGPALRARISPETAGHAVIGARVRGVAHPDGGPGVIFAVVST